MPSSETNDSSASVGPRRAATARVAAASSARVWLETSAAGSTATSRTIVRTPFTTEGSRSSSPTTRSIRWTIEAQSSGERIPGLSPWLWDFTRPERNPVPHPMSEAVRTA